MYHGGGLLPAKLGPQTYVASPSAFFPKGDRWAIRHLTTRELLESYGIPSLQVLRMDQAGFSSWEALLLVESLIAAGRLFMGVTYHGSWV